MNKIIKAKVYAKVAHYKQKYGDKPYFNHLNQVYQKVKQYTNDENILAAALLHDVLEDTKYTRKSIITDCLKHIQI